MNLRERIIEFFENEKGKFRSEKSILSELELKENEIRQFGKEIEKLLSIGYLLKKKNSFAKNPTSFLFKGKFVLIKGGGGFFIPEENEIKDIFIKKENTLNAIDGDTVLCRINKEKNSAKVLFIVKRSKKNVVGMISKGYFLPFEGGEPLAVLSKVDKNIGIATFDEDGRLKKDIKILGEPYDPGTCIKAVELKYNLSKGFQQEVEEEALKYGKIFKNEWLEGRKDLRALPTITIDPIDAKDFDDAISIEKLKNGNYKIFVHIADVSFFVKENTKLDEEAKERGNSVYLPQRVYPMLPENLSNNLCSLNEGEDKPGFTVEIEVTPDGDVKKFSFYASVIRSIKRLTYEEAEGILDNNPKFGTEIERIAKTSYEVALVLNARRRERGALDFDLPEPRLNLGSSTIVESVFKEVRLKSHRLIEEFMLLANQVVAEFLFRKKIPFLYRIHEEPDEKKIEELSPLLSIFGDNFLRKTRKPTSKDIQRILERAKGKPYERVINKKVLRAMMKAKYSFKPYSHYGLALERYCHFTSPIRRYPDLVVHRILKKTLFGFAIDARNLEKLATHLSEREQNGDEAEREAINWLILIYLSDKLGNYFDALITGFTKFGVKIELLSELIEGICPFSFIDYDHFLLDRSGFLVKGKYTSRIFKVGQIVKVQLVKTDLFVKEAQFKIV